MATPITKGKMVKLKKSDVIAGRLNTTKGSKTAATPKNAAMNFSYLNNSVTRQTLRANNRALAQGLARLKLELRQERIVSMELRAEVQELKLDASRLRRLVGLKDEQIDEEVKKRMKEQFAAVSDLVERAVSGHLAAGKSLTELQDKCIEIERQTPSSNRNSIAESTGKEAACNLKQSSDSRDRDVEDGSARNLFDGLPPVPSSALTSRHTDISMIAEQSILVEPNTQGTQPQQLAEKKPSPEMTTVPKKKAKKTSKMPQRVPTKQKYQPPDFSRPSIADKSKTKEQLLKTSDNRNPFNQKQTLHQSPKKRTLSDPDLDPFKPTRTLLRSPRAGELVRNTGIDESPQEKIDSRDFLACLVDETAGILDEPLPGPTFGEDSTQFFNSDMELTSVIDMSKLAPPTSKSPNLPMEQVVETTERNTKNDVMTVRGKHDKTGKTAVKSSKCSNDKEVKQASAKTATEATAASDSDQADQASVEVKNLKPGVFTFSVSRKEADGSRKPVPDKKSQARSKKKTAKVVEEEAKEARKTDDRDMFNFGDRTPTVPLEKLQKPASTVYDVSMNESAIAPQTSLHSFLENIKDKDKPGKESRVQPSEDNKQKKGTQEPSNIYYLPLKGCEDDEPSEKQSRSISRSRKRIISEEDEDWVPEKQSKPRSRSRKRNSSGEENDWVPSHRSKSRSRSKKRISSEADDKNAEEKLQPSPEKKSKSVIETESPEKSVRRSARSRSRPRELESSEDKVERPTRSKSRQRKPADDKDKEDELPMPVNTEERSRSRSIVRRGKNDQPERVSTRSKSRPREVKDTDDEASPVKVTGEKSSARSKPEDEEENMHEGVERSARSRSRVRKNEDNDSPKKEILEKQSRRRSCSESEDQPMKVKESVKRSARSKSRPRLPVDSDNEEIKSEGKSESDSRQSRPIEKTDVRRSARSKSRPRLAVDTDNEESSAQASTETESKQSRPVEKVGLKRPARSKSRPRLVVDSDNEESSAQASTETESRQSRPVEKVGLKRPARSKSRPRLVVDSDNEESSAQASTETESRQSRPVEKVGLKRPARSKSRPRLVVDSDNEESSAQASTETESRQSRPVEKVGLKRPARSKSRPRLVVDSDNVESSAKASTGTDSKQSRPVENKALKRSARSRSQPRLEMDSDNEDGSAHASSETNSRQSRPVEKATLKRSARSRSRPRIIALSDDEESPVKSTEEKDKIQSKSKLKCDTKDSRKHSEGSKSDIDIPTDGNEDCKESHLAERSSPRKSHKLSKANTKNEEITASEKQTEKPDERNDKSDHVKNLKTNSCDPNNRNSHGNKKDQKKDLDSHVYYMPLKGSPTATEKPKSSRERSRSRSRARESEPDENSNPRRRSERRTTHSESEDKDEAEIEELLKMVSVRSRSTRKRDAGSNEHKESVDTGLVLPDFVFNCDSPVKHAGDQDNKVSEEKSNKPSLNSKEQKLLTDLDDDEEVILLTPNVGTEVTKSRLLKSTKTEKTNSATQGNSKSARKQKNETQGSRSKSKSNRNRMDSPVKDVIDVGEIEKNSVKSKSKSTKKEVKDPKKSGETGLVLPEFILSPDKEVSNSVEIDNFVSKENARLPVPTEQKVLKDRNSDINIGSDSDVTKRSRQKRDSKKLSTKTPKSEEEDFKVPKTKTVKGKSSRKPRSASGQSSEKKVVNSSDTPKAESDGDPDGGAKVSRKRLDRKFVDPEDFADGQERSPASRKKIPRRDGSDTNHRTSDKGNTNDENEQPMNTLAKLKQKLSMISSRPRPSMIDVDTGDGDAGHETEEEPADRDEDHEDQGKRSRRKKQAVSYCPKPLNSKLRRGDDMFEKKALSKENAEKARLLMSKKMLNP